MIDDWRLSIIEEAVSLGLAGAASDVPIVMSIGNIQLSIGNPRLGTNVA
jgi:hypothetical protein